MNSILLMLKKANKDISKLEKKIITDKEGHQRTVYVKPEDAIENKVKPDTIANKKREIKEHKRKRLKDLILNIMDILERHYQGRSSEYETGRTIDDYSREQLEISKRRQELKDLKKKQKENNQKSYGK
jgi:hypothetical protein